MVKMNEETKEVYAKYGVSPMGSCLQLLIQMPILFALYRVIWNIPAYVNGVKEAFMPLAEKIMSISGSQQYLSNFAASNNVDFENSDILPIRLLTVCINLSRQTGALWRQTVNFQVFQIW